MTKIWGPLGWMTLHSVSAIYPENPTPAEKAILSSFIESFRDSITCGHCKGHFTSMFNTYKSIHPEWNASRFDFFLFVCRAHNTVNRRLDKPIIPTIKDCIETLQSNTKINSPAVFRQSYFDHVIRNWSRDYSSEGFIQASNAKKMKKINDEYFNPRDKTFADLSFDRDASVVEFIPENADRYRASRNVPDPISYKNVKIGFQGGRLRLTRN
jgi:hypothetical protein